MRVLVIVAHPDDELLGCGGTVAALVAAGHAADSFIIGDGVTSRRHDRDTAAAIEERAVAARMAAAAISAGKPRFGGLPDQRFDRTDLLDIVQKIEDVIADISPDIVLTHHGNDLNNDHRIVHRAVLTACRPLLGSTLRAVYTFEILSSTEWGSPNQGQPFRPQVYVDISMTLEKKLAALACYRNEMKPFPHPRSSDAVRALAQLRGSEVGFSAAEAFEVVWARGVIGAKGSVLGL